MKAAFNTAPKGHNKIAQGNALGNKCKEVSAALKGQNNYFALSGLTKRI